MQNKWNGQSPQIVSIHGNNKLIEFINMMRPVSSKYPCHLYANGEEKNNNGFKIQSFLKLQILDYSDSDGKKSLVSFNFSPEEIAYVYDNIRIHFPISVEQERFYAGKVKKIQIKYYATDKNGNPRSYPWFISIEQGTGEGVKSSTGGTYIKKGSYNLIQKNQIFLTEQDMHTLFWKTYMSVEKFIFSQNYDIPEYQHKETMPAATVASTQEHSLTDINKFTVTTLGCPEALENHKGAYKILCSTCGKTCEVIFMPETINKLMNCGIWQQMKANLSFDIYGKTYDGVIPQILVTGF